MRVCVSSTDERACLAQDFLGEGPSQTEFVNEFLERRKAIRHLLDMPSVDVCEHPHNCISVSVFD